MRVKLPLYLRVVQWDERGPGYLVRNVTRRGFTPDRLYQLERSMQITLLAVFAEIRDDLGDDKAFRFLDACTCTDMVRVHVSKSGQTVYAVRCFATIPNFEKMFDPASIEFALEMAGLTQDDFPAAQEEPFWILIFKPIDKEARAKAIYELRLETDPTYYEYEKARNE